MKKKDIFIGIAGVIALLALFFGIKFLKGENLFDSNTYYYVHFSNAHGLVKSSAVYADGYQVGIVSDIIYDYDHPGNVLVEISVDPKLKLRVGTRVQIDSGLMGGCTLNVYPGSNLGSIYQRGDTIPGSEALGLMSKAADLVPQVQGLASKVDTLVVSLNRLVNNPDIPLILSNVEQVSKDLTVTTHHLNSLLENDFPKLASTYNKVGENAILLTEKLNGVDIEGTLANVDKTVKDVDRMILQMQSPEGTLGALMKDRGLYDNLNHTVQSADSLLTDFKSRPKRYIHFSVFGRKDK